MEAAVRTAHFLLTGENCRDLKVQPLRGLDGCKELRATLAGRRDRRGGGVSGLGNARKLLDEIRAGRNDLHFIEVMTCPGGCINGGGQPLGTRRRTPSGPACRRSTRSTATRRCAPRTTSPAIKRLYAEFLGEPLREKSHHLLHTHYAARDVVL